MHSRQRAWWPTHEFLTEYLAKANLGVLPAAGTPRWCALADGDPRKLAALAVDGEHFVLRCEIAQEAAAGASKTIAAAEDWPAVARQIRAGRGSVYIPRRAS